MDETTNSYSIGIFGNQVAAATCPSYGATMLETLAQKITGEDELTLEFNNLLLPVSPDVFPLANPNVAEIYGVITLAAIIFVMNLQIKWMGKPINSGFYEAYITQGGYKSGYLLAKYAKAVVTNIMLCVVI